MKYISMLSGGQDSTAMTLRLLELGKPVDYIVFCDTGLEHNEMYEYIDKLENKLYQHFTRTGCAVCPKQSEGSKYMVYKHYPEKWAYMKRVEKELNEDPNRTGIYPRWHDILTIDQLEEKFKKKDKQLTFELDFEPLSDCFCKI